MAVSLSGLTGVSAYIGGTGGGKRGVYVNNELGEITKIKFECQNKDQKMRLSISYFH